MGTNGNGGFLSSIGGVAANLGKAVLAFIVAILIGCIVGAIMAWKIGLVVFAVISIVAVYFLYRAFKARDGAVRQGVDFVRSFTGSGPFGTNEDAGLNWPPTRPHHVPLQHKPSWPASSRAATGGSPTFVDGGSSSSGSDTGGGSSSCGCSC